MSNYYSDCCHANVDSDAQICLSCGEHCTVLEPCDACDGRGVVDELDVYKVNCMTISPPYVEAKCEKCDGDGELEINN